MKRIAACIAVSTLALAGCETTEEDPALAGAVIGSDQAAASGLVLPSGDVPEGVALPPETAGVPQVAGSGSRLDSLTGSTVSVVSGTQPNGQPFHLRRATRTLWLYESGDTSVPMDVTHTDETYIEMLGIGDWTGRIKIDLAAGQVEVGDRDWSRVTKMPIQSAS